MYDGGMDQELAGLLTDSVGKVPQCGDGYYSLGGNFGVKRGEKRDIFGCFCRKANNRKNVESVRRLRV